MSQTIKTQPHTTLQKHLTVHWWDGTPVGHVVNRGSIYFFYDEEWIRSGHNLSPLSLPFRANVGFNGHKGVDGVAGLIADCLPDQWGQLVAAREFERQGLGRPTPMGLLAFRGTRGIGALQFKPALDRGGRATDSRLASAVDLAALAKGAHEIERGLASEVLPQLAQGASPGGRRPKALVLVYPDGTLQVSPPDGIGTPSLLKFDLSVDGEEASVEHAYALMSAAAGIRTVNTQIIAEGKGTDRRHLVVRRFDTSSLQEPQRRLHCHSLSTMLHKTPGELDYRDFYRSAVRLGLPLAEIEEITRRMVFNVLAANADDHGKNHSFIYREESKTWELSPAYDLVYTPMMLERGMTIAGDVWPKMDRMATLAVDAGVECAKFDDIVARIDGVIADWGRFADEAHVPVRKTKEIAERFGRIRASVFPTVIAPTVSSTNGNQPRKA